MRSRGVRLGASGVSWLSALCATLAACTSNPAPRDAGADARGDGGLDVAAEQPPLVTGPDVAPLDVARPEVPEADAAPPADAADAADATDAPLRCADGVDSDLDRIANAEECRLGTDPFNPDSDGDGIVDGVEVGYGRVCVAPAMGMQRRPPMACEADAACAMGERCAGLDPRARDSDGDGVADGLEDRNLDGRIDAQTGETDPRLADTDGDGQSDGMGGVAICRPSGLATVTQLGLPMADVQAGFDPAWGVGRRVTGTMNRRGVMLDDVAANLSGLVVNAPSTRDAREESARVELTVRTALGVGATPVLVGRPLTTHEMNDAVTSTFRVARATSASALRDAVAGELLGVTVTPGPATVGSAGEFLVDVTTVRRTMGRLGVGTADVLVAVSPRADYENNTRPTALRAIDLVNGTATAEIDKGLGAHCQVIRATRTPTVDFLWTVDTSESMGPYQQRLGNTAVQFFTRLRLAGVDFRVGVFEAGTGEPNLDSPGFRWIMGADPSGARRLCEDVTSRELGMCPTSATDTASPYEAPGLNEVPVGAAVTIHNQMVRRAMAGETNLDRRFREGARLAAFFVTDEPGTNDMDFFAMRSDPQTGAPWGATPTAAWPRVVDYFRRNNILTFGLVSNSGGAGPLPASATPVPCAMGRALDTPRCVIEGNRGAYIPIATATDAEVSAAMARVVEAVVGASSPYALERSPITSTLKVRVRGADVPRSRENGFDYDSVSRTVVFYGSTHRPMTGDEVVISYRVWQPCPSSGAACASDNDCCAPHVCFERRCQPPCRPFGSVCAGDGDCCAPWACVSGRCAPRPMCVAAGARCTAGGGANDCCAPDVCLAGTCAACRGADEACTRDGECCGGVSCTMGRCGCRPSPGRCTTPRECCSRYCVEGTCGPG